MSSNYKLTTAKGIEYIQKELDFIDKNYNFINSIFRKLSFFLHISYWQGIFKLCRRIDIILKNNKNRPYIIHKDKIELEIITKCNMRCYHCDRSCRQAPSDEYMTVEQIKYFIDESIRVNRKWPFIVIIGGEPTLHPNIYEIFDLFIEYKLKHSPNTKITISTNGVGPITQEVLKNLPNIVHHENSSKTTIKNTHFYTFNVAPIDLEKYNKPEVNFSNACTTVSTAGTALTRYGYYACGAIASNDRVIGLDIGIKNINDITEKAYRRQLGLLCRYCGLFKSKKDDDYGLEEISPAWQKIYYEYAKKKPELTLYGNSINVVPMKSRGD